MTGTMNFLDLVIHQDFSMVHGLVLLPLLESCGAFRLYQSVGRCEQRPRRLWGVETLVISVAGINLAIIVDLEEIPFLNIRKQIGGPFAYFQVVGFSVSISHFKIERLAFFLRYTCNPP